jgi:Tat protein translocase TatB subunit
MDFFGIGPLNLLIILAVALMVFGPDRLPEMAARAGKLFRELREYASDVTSEFSSEFSEFQNEFNQVGEQARGFGNELRESASGIGGSLRDAAQSSAEPDSAKVDGLNAPPPGKKLPDNIVALGGGAARPRVDDYKPE